MTALTPPPIRRLHQCVRHAGCRSHPDLVPGIGTVRLGLIDAWRSLGEPGTTTHAIAFGQRLPRAIKALLAGGYAVVVWGCVPGAVS